MVSSLESASAFSYDVGLLRTLKLEVFKDIPCGVVHPIGRVTLEDGSWVEIKVTAMPALFWDATIRCEETWTEYHVSTGSMAFVDAWPLFYKLATGMLVVDTAEQTD